MASRGELDQLGRQGAEADELFAGLMIAHHQGGIHMAKYAADHAGTARVREIVDAVVRNQGRDRRVEAALQRLLDAARTGGRAAMSLGPVGTPARTLCRVRPARRSAVCLYGVVADLGVGDARACRDAHRRADADRRRHDRSARGDDPRPGSAPPTDATLLPHRASGESSRSAPTSHRSPTTSSCEALTTSRLTGVRSTPRCTAAYAELAGGIFPVYPGRGRARVRRGRTTTSRSRQRVLLRRRRFHRLRRRRPVPAPRTRSWAGSVIGVVLAHEWGHAIQRGLGFEYRRSSSSSKPTASPGVGRPLARGENPALEFADDDLMRRSSA